ncbi:MAG TPA: DUF1653 domain-containing protein [Candidatus Binatia bacterium]|nr:DUF1653 domain-containing protein [Candidatus Binatia bacterium]
MNKHDDLSERALSLKPGIYRHFKGGEYQVFGVCRHSETEEEMVIYQHLYGDYTWWVRPLSMFTENVERDGYSGPRFVFVAQNR